MAALFQELSAALSHWLAADNLDWRFISGSFVLRREWIGRLW